MKKVLFSLFFFSGIVFSGRLTVDITHIDPLTSAVFKDVEEAFGVNERGLDALEIGNFEEAEEFFAEASKMLPIYSDAKNNLGVLYYRTNRTQEAIKVWQELLLRDPEYFVAWYNLGLAQLKLGDKERARDYFSRAVGVEDAWLYYSYLLVETGDTLRAIGILEEKMQYPAAVKTLAEIYAVKRDFGKALFYLEKLEINSFDDSESRYLNAVLIYALINEERFDDAKKVLDGMGKVDDNNFNIEYLRGFTALNSQQYAESKRALERALEISPDNYAAKGLLAFVLINMGDEKRAEKLWRESIKSDTLNNQSHINLAVLAENKGQKDTALHYYRLAANISENAGVRVSMGNIFSEKKQYDSAMIHYRLAFESAEWRTKALAGAYFAALGLKDTVYADRIASFLGASDTGDYVIRVLSDHAYRKGDFLSSTRLVLSLVNPLPQDYLRLGWANLALKNINGALAAVDSAKNHKADENEIAKLRQQIAFEKGDYDSALSFGDNSPTGIYNRVIILYRSQNFTEALKESIIAADLFSGAERVEMIRIAANSAAVLKNWATALRWFSLLAQLEVNAQNALNVAIAAYNENNLTLTKEFYYLAKQLDATIFNRDIELRLEYEERSKEETEMLSSSLPAVDSLFNDALNFHLAGDTENAMKLYNQVLEIDRRHYRAWNNLGAIYGERGEIDSAIRAYENAVSRRADIIDGYVNLVNIYSAIGDKNNARRWLRRGLGLDPQNANLLFFKGQLGE